MTPSLEEKRSIGAPPGVPIIVYTCCYGTAEPLNPDVFGKARLRFPCFVFSDNASLPVPDGVVLVHDPLIGLDANRASRRAKLMPDLFLPPCEWSIYLDNKLFLSVDPEKLIASLQQHDTHFLFVTRHPRRICLYDEAETCIRRGKESAEKISDQMRHYEAMGFPRNAGLLHGGFLIRRHGSEALRQFGTHWFEHVLAFSRRDQLSFPFVTNALGVDPFYLPREIDGEPLLEFRAGTTTEWRAMEMARVGQKQKSFWSRAIKFFKKGLRRKPKASRSAEATTAISALYRERLGKISSEAKGSGAVLVKYEVDNQFDYETYREIQNAGNRLKLEYQWVGRDQMAFVAGLVKEFSGVQTRFGLCHGTRRGNEQLWLNEFLGGDLQVIGTEIADTASEFPNTVQWDFHKENPDWIGRADFVYSNSWDHSYDPVLAFGVWINSLRPGGVLVLDWTDGHSESGVTEMDPFGASLEHLQAMLNEGFSHLGKVVACRQADKHKSQQIWSVVFKKEVV